MLRKMKFFVFIVFLAIILMAAYTAWLLRQSGNEKVTCAACLQVLATLVLALLTLYYTYFTYQLVIDPQADREREILGAYGLLAEIAHHAAVRIEGTDPDVPSSRKGSGARFEQFHVDAYLRTLPWIMSISRELRKSIYEAYEPIVDRDEAARVAHLRVMDPKAGNSPNLKPISYGPASHGMDAAMVRTKFRVLKDLLDKRYS